MTRIIALLLASLACAAFPAQAAERLPIIAGQMAVYVLVETDGTVKTWGTPGAGEGPYLGDGTERAKKDPAQLVGVRDIVGVAVGDQHILLLTSKGTVLAWGRNEGCEVGTGDDKKRLSPIPVAGLHGVKQIAASVRISAALLEDGTVWMWGTNEYGLLANGRSGYQEPCANKPVKVEGLTDVKQIVTDSLDVLVLKKDGTVWGWGKNEYGELGNGATEPQLHPVQMKGIANAVDIGVNGNTAVVLADGTLWMCGPNKDGEMAESPKKATYTTPFKIPGIHKAAAVVIADGVTMVRLADGTLLGWGVGYHGLLGDGHEGRISHNPHPPVGLGPVLVHYIASHTGYAIRADGTVMGWGIYAGENSPSEWVYKPIPVFKVKLAN